MIKKGKRYKTRPIFGSNWNNSVICSSRSVNWNNSPLSLNSNYGGRGVADTGAKHNSLADLLPLSKAEVSAEHTTTVHSWLVAINESQE
jgi:hypothetical protein